MKALIFSLRPGLRREALTHFLNWVLCRCNRQSRYGHFTLYCAPYCPCTWTYEWSEGRYKVDGYQLLCYLGTINAIRGKGIFFWCLVSNIVKWFYNVMNKFLIRLDFERCFYSREACFLVRKFQFYMYVIK